MRWIRGARPRTLPAALVPVLVGTGLAAHEAEVVWWRAAVALLVALSLQIGVNYANDYSDGIRGTDDARVGPRRLVASGDASARAVLVAAVVCFSVAAVAGLVLVAASGAWWLLLIGALAIVAAWTYTGGPLPYGYHGLGEVAVFVFFGLFAVAGTFYVQAEHLPWVVWPVASAVGLLACALLAVNNLRDRAGDAAAGKRTLAVRMGDVWARRLYAGFVLAPFIIVATVGVWEPWVLLALLALPLVVSPLRRVFSKGTASGHKARELIRALGETGRLQLAFGALFTLGLWVSV